MVRAAIDRLPENDRAVLLTQDLGQATTTGAARAEG
jgi:DNA-directed RNA polymerase specialized sigma24 family protein